MKTPINIGIIGCGNVLEAYVPECRKLEARGLARLVGGCGRAHQRERALALGLPLFFENELPLLENPEIDLMVILASMPQHAALGRAALLAGKHVLMEKPLATNLADAAELIRLAEERNLEIVCAPFTILSPTFQTMAARVRAGDIGRPCLARSRYGWAGPWWSEWFYKEGGGPIFDLAVYCITTLTGLLGPAKRVIAMTGISIPERNINGQTVRVETPDNAQITLEFEGSAFGTIMSGFTMQQYRSPAIEVCGTTGTIQMLGDDWDPDGYELWQNSAGCWQIFKEATPDWPWADGLRHAVESLQQGTKPLVTPQHALHVLEIMLKTQQAGQEGIAIQILSTFERPAFGHSSPAEAAHLQHDRSRIHLESRGEKGPL